MVSPKSLRGLRQGSLLSFTVLAILTLVSSGWGTSFAQSPAHSDQPGESNGGAPADRDAISDESLTVDEYLQLGLPDPGRVWSVADMVNAEKILTSLAMKGYRHLPRYKSERSGEVFSRLTSPQNLDLFKNRKFPVGPRLAQVLDYTHANNQLFTLYLTGVSKKEVGEGELVEFMAAHCHSFVVTLNLIDEFLPAIKKDDPQYEARMKAIDHIRRGVATYIASLLQILVEPTTYRTSELVRFVGYMQETFPSIVPRLLPASRTETLVRLGKMQENPALEHLQPGLKELYSKVKAAVEKEAAPIGQRPIEEECGEAGK